MRSTSSADCMQHPGLPARTHCTPTRTELGFSSTTRSSPGTSGPRKLRRCPRPAVWASSLSPVARPYRNLAPYLGQRPGDPSIRRQEELPPGVPRAARSGSADRYTGRPSDRPVQIATARHPKPISVPRAPCTVTVLPIVKATQPRLGAGGPWDGPSLRPGIAAKRPSHLQLVTL